MGRCSHAKPQIVAFSVFSLSAAVFVLYPAFAFDTLLSRDRRITESDVVRFAATFLSPALPLLVIFIFVGGLTYRAILTVFP